jgi:predicted dienelactone hydrolase
MKKRTKLACALVLLAKGLATTPAARADTRHEVDRPYNAGVTVRSLTPSGDFNWRGSKRRSLAVTVWYPVKHDVAEVTIDVPATSPLWHADRAALDAPPLAVEHGHPLVVLSHGFGSAASQLAWLGAALARRGFVAAAVSHPGNSSDDVLTPEGFALRWERARDLRAVIDGVLADQTLGKIVDGTRIGAAGFSLGGTTVITLAGGRTDLGEFDSYCAEHRKACVPPADVIPMLGQVAAKVRTDAQLRTDLRRAGDSYRDERVRAVFAMAPAFGHSFIRTSLASIAIPVRIVVGDADDVAPAAIHASYFVQLIKGARLEVLAGGVGHFVFLDLPTARAERELVRYAVDAPGVDRAAIHQRVAAMASAFFTEALYR